MNFLKFQLVVILLTASVLAVVDSASILESAMTKNYDYNDYNDYSGPSSLDYQDTQCSCKNGGACVLDFCVCMPHFTGRQCEIDLRGPKVALGCGRLINGESEFVKCAKCTCEDQILTCISLSTMTCDRFSASEASRLKGTDLKDLLALMYNIETDAYSMYVREYLDQDDYRVHVKSVEDISEKTKTDSKDSKQKELIVLKANHRIVSLYFPQKSQTDYANVAIRLQIGVNGVLSLFVVILGVKLNF